MHNSRRLALILSTVAALGSCAKDPPKDVDLSASYAALFREDTETESIGAESETWSVAVEPRSFEFPRDHGSHESFRIEWWYYTGNLRTSRGERFGYQLTFFRTGFRLRPENPSRWAVRNVYTAHFAVSDVGQRQHRCFERHDRGALDRAGARTDRLEVWNGDWRVEMADGLQKLVARDVDVAIDLTLQPVKEPVLHGAGGLSQKGPARGNASYYYSIPRLATSGTVTVAGRPYDVTGQSWMDHEFSTSFLETGQAGWDWFALQLDDGVDLMLYRMRRADGTADPFSSGSLIDRAGRVTRLAAGDFRLTPLEYWQSPVTTARYPLRWRIELPHHDYQLTVTAAFEAQEMTTRRTTGIDYWEGAIQVDGTRSTGTVTGHGYLELTGYAGRGLGSLLGE